MATCERLRMIREGMISLDGDDEETQHYKADKALRDAVRVVVEDPRVAKGVRSELAGILAYHEERKDRWWYA